MTLGLGGGQGRVTTGELGDSRVLGGRKVAVDVRRRQRVPRHGSRQSRNLVGAEPEEISDRDRRIQASTRH